MAVDDAACAIGGCHKARIFLGMCLCVLQLGALVATAQLTCPVKLIIISATNLEEQVIFSNKADGFVRVYEGPNDRVVCQTPTAGNTNNPSWNYQCPPFTDLVGSPCVTLDVMEKTDNIAAKRIVSLFRVHEPFSQTASEPDTCATSGYRQKTHQEQDGRKESLTYSYCFDCAPTCATDEYVGRSGSGTGPTDFAACKPCDNAVCSVGQTRKGRCDKKTGKGYQCQDCTRPSCPGSAPAENFAGCTLVSDSWSCLPTTTVTTSTKTNRSTTAKTATSTTGETTTSTTTTTTTTVTTEPPCLYSNPGTCIDTSTHQCRGAAVKKGFCSGGPTVLCCPTSQKDTKPPSTATTNTQAATTNTQATTTTTPASTKTTAQKSTFTKPPDNAPPTGPHTTLAFGPATSSHNASHNLTQPTATAGGDSTPSAPATAVVVVIHVVVALLVVLCLIAGCCYLRRKRANTSVVNAVRRHAKERRCITVTVANAAFTPTAGSMPTADRDDTSQRVPASAEGTDDASDIGVGASLLTGAGKSVEDGVGTASRFNSAIVDEDVDGEHRTTAHEAESNGKPAYSEPLTTAHVAVSSTDPPAYATTLTTMYVAGSTGTPAYSEPLTTAYVAGGLLQNGQPCGYVQPRGTDEQQQHVTATATFATYAMPDGVQYADHADYATVDGSSGAVASLHGFGGDTTDVDA